MSASFDPASLVTKSHREAFHHDLLAWYRSVRRDMPWRETNDPYRIWLSEVMLQQTRVDQAQPYYERFVEAFPTVEVLADASIDDVLRLWEGLGYYSRARNLHRAARMICDTFDGCLPEDYDAIRTLPGVGPYTASAVLSIAFGLPHAVLDGNVVRVLTRVFAIDDDVTRSRTRRRLQALADALLAPNHAGDFNQAMMELGATVCTPTSPACTSCPVRSACRARAEGTVEVYPVKKKKPPVPHHDIVVGLLFDERGDVFIQRRSEEQMLGGLWEFPGGKREEGESLEDACRRELREELGVEVELDGLFHKLSHAYSHFKITLYAYRCRVVEGTPTPPPGVPSRWVSLAELDEYAFPRANRRLIEMLQERRTRPTLFDQASGT